MTLEQRADVVLACAKVLFVNGQSTDRVLSTIDALGTSLATQVFLIPRWGAIELEISDRKRTVLRAISASPDSVHMNRVNAAMHTIAALRDRRLQPQAAKEALEDISQMSPAPLPVFMLAAAGGAAAVAVLAGLQDGFALMVTFAIGGTGALLRRLLARLTANLFIQPFAAALLAGLAATILAPLHPGLPIWLVAISPCLILVPGPHVLNGVLDLMGGRIQLGAARLGYATLIILAISSGLLLGLSLTGVSLPVETSVAAVPFWLDAIAAAIAVASYSTFFAMPLRMLAWPTAIGVLAHAFKWMAQTGFGLGSVAGVFLACSLVGIVMTPVSHRTHMPFAAIGFASVVSMMPGNFIFRMFNGLIQIDGTNSSAAMIGQVLSDATTALVTIMAMSLGLIVPKLVIDRLSQTAVSSRQTHTRYDIPQPRETTR